MLKKSIYTLSIFLVASLFILSGCDKKNEQKFEKKKSSVKIKNLKLTVGAVVTPEGGKIYYKQLFDYIEKKLAIKIERIDKKSYDETNIELKKQKIDGGFVCSGPYVDGAKDFGLELLVVPQMYDKVTYNSYIISRKDSNINSFKDLRGKSFAFADPKSNTGYVVPIYMLSKMNETPKSFFKSFIYTHGHDKSIWAVVEGVVDGAAVDSLVWKYMNIEDSKYTTKTKIIAKSKAFGLPPFVVRKGLDKKLKQKLKNILLNMHKDKVGKNILTHMMIDKFVEAKDIDYDSVREIKKYIQEYKVEK